jgi:acyl-CoA synthetase (AMP-forming)/AMP-acid ligase II
MSSLAEVERSLLAPGTPFELSRERVLGHEMAVFAHRLPSLRAMLETSRAHGDSEYCICEGARLTFAEHLRRVAAFSRVLRDVYGVGKGDRVAILAENGPEWIIAFWSAVSLGAIVVGMNGWWVRDEVVYALEDAEPAVLIADEKRLAPLPRLRQPPTIRCPISPSAKMILPAFCTPAERRAVRKVRLLRIAASSG